MTGEKNMKDVFDKVNNFNQHSMLKEAGLYLYFKEINSDIDAEVVIDGKRMIMMGSNNYLGLTNHPNLKKAAIEAIENYGTGCTGSRLLNGTLKLHTELESKLEKFIQKEAVLVFSGGYLSNLGAISALAGRHENIIIDRKDHASIVDGCKLSGSKLFRYKNQDMDDLRRVLERIDINEGKLIIVDGVFSMEGDIAPLPEIVNIAKEYNARVMVDEAHGIGVMGEEGRGVCSHFGLTDEVDIIMGTFSKTFASCGGFIASSRKVIDYLKHNSRPFIFTASSTPSTVATVIAALDTMEQEPERVSKLEANGNYWREGLIKIGFDTGTSTTPIVPVIIGSDELTLKFCARLMEKGVFANPVLSPATPPGRSLIRTSCMATHTFEQLEEALGIFAEVKDELNI
jgi:8-amino-7-oxononanoate synthase